MPARKKLQRGYHAALAYAQRPEDYRMFLGERSCLTCGTKFEAREKTSKYCCHPCYWKSKKGKPPPWLKA